MSFRMFIRPPAYLFASWVCSLCCFRVAMKNVQESRENKTRRTGRIPNCSLWGRAMDDFFLRIQRGVVAIFAVGVHHAYTDRVCERKGIEQPSLHLSKRCWPTAVVVRLNHSPKTMTSVILTVFILALGMRPRELARLQSASSSAACPSAKKYTPEALIRL